MKLPDDFQYTDGRMLDMPIDIKPAENQDTVDRLRSENAYLKGKIAVYEKLLKIKEEE